MELLSGRIWSVLIGITLLLLAQTNNVAAQRPCSVPQAWTSSFQQFSNQKITAIPNLEGKATYDAIKGVRFDGNLGKERFTFYNFPTAWYLVNTTIPDHAVCTRLDCKTECFKPFTVGGVDWRFNSTVVVGTNKVERWSTFSKSEPIEETVVIDQPLASSGYKQCLLVTHNSVYGTEENNVGFTFGLWYSTQVQPFIDPDEFKVPKSCPKTNRDAIPLNPAGGGHPSLNSVQEAVLAHFLYLNRIYHA